MNTLYFYGCSYGKFGTSEDNIWVDENSASQYLAKRLDLQLVNRSVPGTCNYALFREVTLDLEKGNIKPDDLVIVQWSHIDRAFSNLGYTIMPWSADTNPIVRDYYKNFHDDHQSFSLMVGWNEYLKSRLKNSYFFSFSDFIRDLQNSSNYLYNEFVSDDRVILFDGVGIKEYLFKLGDPKQTSVFFKCGHPSKIGHEFLGETYYKGIVKRIKGIDGTIESPAV